jgi:hypothetical protein
MGLGHPQQDWKWEGDIRTAKQEEQLLLKEQVIRVTVED